MSAKPTQKQITEVQDAYDFFMASAATNAKRGDELALNVIKIFHDNESVIRAAFIGGFLKGKEGQ